MLRNKLGNILRNKYSLTFFGFVCLLRKNKCANLERGDYAVIFDFFGVKLLVSLFHLEVKP